MSGQEPETTTVRYTAKELFSRIDQKLDVIAALLAAKADHDELVALEVRVAVLEATASEQKGFDRAKVAIVGLLLTIVGLLVPFVLELVHR
jgi:hypothetical protein